MPRRGCLCPPAGAEHGQGYHHRPLGNRRCGQPEAAAHLPEGFPDELIHEFEEKTGHKVLCNKPYSGTQVLKDYGEQAMKENALIVYTSADSVFQVAANEELVPVQELYRYCEIAREMLKGKYGVGRVIARPFLGQQRGYLLPHHQPPRPEPEAAPLSPIPGIKVGQALYRRCGR